MGTKKRLKSFVKDDRPLKLKAYVLSHNVDVIGITLGDGRRLLHYCAQYGSPEMLRCLLRLDCDPSLQDKGGNLPLHVAASRALHEDVHQAEETFAGIVTPLVHAYPLGQDVENRSGVTGHDLLTSLKKKLKTSSSVTGTVRRELPQNVKEEEDEMWRRKLAEEFQFETEEQMPRYDQQEDIVHESREESYENWCERMRSEYLSRHQRIPSDSSKNRKRRRDEDGRRERKSKVRQTKLEEQEKLNKAREELKKNFKPPPVETSESRLLSKKKRYETKFAHLLNHLSGKTLTFANIPWPCMEIELVTATLFCDLPNKESAAYKKYLRTQQIRWHPDKFTQKLGDHLHPDHTQKIMNRVKAISQILNRLQGS